jgi:DNA-binding response OmpR family regulator
MAHRILVVDDSSTIRKVVCAMLTRHGYETAAAVDGVHALEILAQDARGFDLALLDFVMPKMNGFQFCRALQSRTDIKLLPVVLMSAKTDKIREHFVLQTGAVDALAKPFDSQTLLRAVDGALRRAKSGWAPSASQLELADLDESASSPSPNVAAMRGCRLAACIGDWSRMTLISDCDSDGSVQGSAK